MIMSVVARLKRHPNPTDAEIDAEVTNAALRCSTYPPHPSGDPRRCRESFGGRRDTLMSENNLSNEAFPARSPRHGRCCDTGALVIGFWIPQRAVEPIARRTAPPGPSNRDTRSERPWVVVAPDDTVTIRIAQTELGQGVWTSNAMMVCEELQCDWAKVRPQYASANRDAKEMAPEWTLKVMGNGATDPSGGGEPQFGTRDRTGLAGIPDTLYRRMRTNAAASVKDGRYYLQLAGAEARERLLLAAQELERAGR